MKARGEPVWANTNTKTNNLMVAATGESTRAALQWGREDFRGRSLIQVNLQA